MYSGANMPFQSTAAESMGARTIYWSRPENAVLIPKTIIPGFGQLRAGTIMCAVTAGNRIGQLVPYIPSTDPTTTTGGGIVGKTFVTADVANTGTTCKMLIPDSYRFAVGDELVFMRNNSSSPAYLDGGAITAIDRTTTPGIAQITFTNAAGDANFTVANKTCCYLKSGTSTKFNLALYVLDQDVNTGVGDVAVGANGSVILGNAALMLPILSTINYDAQAKTDLGCVTDGIILYLK